MARAISHPKQASINKAILLAMVGLFVLPLIVAMGLYVAGWKPGHTVNHGVLVQPARPLPDMALQTLQGESVRLRQLRGKWVLVYFGSSACPDACLRNLYEMRQVRLALGVHRERVRRVFVLTDLSDVNGLRNKLRDYPGMVVIAGPARNVTRLTRQFGVGGATSPAQPGVYLVDPLGNLIMHYPTHADPDGMLDDLARLLRYSWVG
ncbi:MAG: SCO family protein [Gammaproteobacteria bacterium]|nr:SCO family protein [Gammaproteobacteria bacterium]